MKPTIPILTLNKAERCWLAEVLRRNLAGDRFSFRDIWSALYKDLPPGFNPLVMDSRLVTSNGEQIRLLGIVALEGNIDVLQEVDLVVNYIKNQLLADPNLERVTVAAIAEATNLASQKVSLIVQVIRQFGEFHRGSSSNADSLLYKDILVSGSDDVYYQYLYFTGITQLIELRSPDSFRQPVESFSFDEMADISAKLDKALEDISLLKIGQEAIWIDMKAEIEELKALFELGKKNWGQMLIGKVSEMVLSGIVSETVSKEVLKYFKSIFSEISKSRGWLVESSINPF